MTGMTVLSQSVKDEAVFFVLDKVRESHKGSGLIVGREQEISEIFSAMKELPTSWLHTINHHPHPFIQFSNLFCLHFKPLGYDGMEFRGIHVKTFELIFCYPDLSQKIMREFYRRIAPGCEIKKIDIR
jgi:hypothetical protein